MEEAVAAVVVLKDPAQQGTADKEPADLVGDVGPQVGGGEPDAVSPNRYQADVESPDDQSPKAGALVAYKEDAPAAVVAAAEAEWVGRVPGVHGQPEEAQKSLTEHQERNLDTDGRSQDLDMKFKEKDHAEGGLKVGEGWYLSLLPILRVLNASGVT